MPDKLNKGVNVAVVFGGHAVVELDGDANGNPVGTARIFTSKAQVTTLVNNAKASRAAKAAEVAAMDDQISKYEAAIPQMAS